MSEFNQIKTRNELADFLSIPRKHLSYILYIKRIENLYTSFEIPKKNGGVRKINAPLDELKKTQVKLAESLYNHRKNHKKKNNISHAFEKNKSIITNAEIHRNKRLVLNIDLENFFDSIHFGRVRGFFNKNNNFLLPIEVATVIAQISCYDGKLPQGSPSSPIISNLICEILDYKLLKIAKKYKLVYTRYADDLTFSTNDKRFLETESEFYKDISKEILKAGFKINEKKKRLQFKDSRQTVTGLVVNEKLNVNRIFYKETRSMAHQLYKTGSFMINGETGTLNQLEGRLAFINQLTWYNNKKEREKKHHTKLSAREHQYQKFLFYKYFFANPKPLIATEGKTDIAYLKAALKNLYKDYPNLISKNSDGSFEFKISFLNRTNRLAYFLGLNKDGASALKKLYEYFRPKRNNKLDYLSYFKKKSNNMPKSPVIFLFDNEIERQDKKPIGNFLNHAKIDNEKKEILKNKYFTEVNDNLYLLTVPLIGDGKKECEIEDLFDKATLSHTINGKRFTKKDKYDTSKYYGKEIFSKYILKNYVNIDFHEFISMLDNINNILELYTKRTVGKDIESNIDIESKEKILIGT